MDNPKYEHDDGSEFKISFKNENLQNSAKSEVILRVEDIDLARVDAKRKLNFTRLTKDSFVQNLTKHTTKKLFILQWITKYSYQDFVGDLIAGFTTGLTVIPQSMALASIAGVPPQYGLYSSFMGCTLYSLFGTNKAVPIGPSAIVALLTYNTIGNRGPGYATLLCFTTGVIQLLMSVTGLGAIVNFVSVPVCLGFTSASAILVMTSQVKDLIGIRGSGGNVLKMCRVLWAHISEISVGDTKMGLGCIATVLLLKKFSAFIRVGPKEEELQTLWQKIINKFIWAVGAFRNSFVVIVCSIISYWSIQSEDSDITAKNPFKTIGNIPNGLPHFGWPEFSNAEESFFDILYFMGSGIIVLPLISSLENISLCRTFADGKPVDTDQELLALGLANMANSLFHGFPVTGAIARGALNYSSGVRTPLGGFFTGVVVMVALLFLTPYFYHIPKTSLAAVIISASFMMIDIKMVICIYKSKKKDMILLLITFFACLLLSLEQGVLVGIFVNIGLVLRSAANPKISIQVEKNHDGIKYLLLTPDRYLIFPSMEHVRQTITKHGLTLDIPVVIDGFKIFEVDFTTANVFSMMSQDFSKKGQFLYLYNLKPSVINVLKAMKNNNIYLCSNKDEFDVTLKKNHGSQLVQEHDQIEQTLTSSM